MLDIRQRTGYLFLAVMLGHVMLISAQVNTRSGGRVLEAVWFGAFAEVQRGVSAVLDGTDHLWSGYVALRGVRVENEVLRQQVADLQMRLEEQRALVRQTVALEALLGLRSRVELPTVAARVVAGDATPGFWTVTVDRGASDGVERDMAVLAPAGVVGRIVGEPAARAARVQLIVGRNAAAGAVIERSRAGGVVMGGSDDPPLRLEYISNLADVSEGDLVVTSGIDGIYPPGFPIGRVESAERGAGLYRTITVRPVVDFSHVDQVLIVLVPPRTPDAEGGS